MNGRVKTRTIKRENLCTDVPVLALLLLVYLFHIDIVVLYTTCTAAVLVSGEPLRLLLHSQMVR